MTTTTATELPRAGPDDSQRLAMALRAAVDGEVRFGAGSRHLYATDASNFRQVPIGVVLPRTTEDVVETVRVCREHGAPITHRGGGTSLAGQACNAAVIIDHSKYLDRIRSVDPQARTATVEPGVVLDTLRSHTQREHGLTWGPDPSTHNRCTVGGMLGNNACGMHAFHYGRTEDNVEELEILLYDGTRMTVGPTPPEELAERIAAGGREGGIYRRLAALRDRHADEIRARFPDIPRRVSGYNLTELLPENGFDLARALVGTEGTCATILTATLSLNEHHPARSLLVLGYPDVYDAADDVGAVRDHEGVIALEGMDELLTERMADKHLHDDALPYLPEGGGWLLVETGGQTKEESDGHARRLMDALSSAGSPPAMKLYDDPDEEEVVWEAREAGLGATAHHRGEDAWPGWEDSAVHPDDVGDYLRDLRGLLDDFGLQASVYGHFGDGCIHCRINFDLTSPDGVDHYRRFLSEAAGLCVDYGGSLSGEHGDGQQRGPLLETMFGAEIVQAFREFKAIFDPDGAMNPGKVVDPAGVDEHLRLGASHREWHPETTFAYPDDGFDFNRAQKRCVGVGKCRRDDGAGTMCPSYMVTKEEQHSTRGRARMLFEMLQPDSELDGWQDDSVREALDLCLSCKGCVTDCPVDVDMATYKSEFLHHHYEDRLHPRVHYAMGLIDVWSRLGSVVPGIANRLLEAPVIGPALKRAAGVARQRPAPGFAARTFRQWFRDRESAVADGAPPVVLFPDTFVNHFQPAVGRATVAVLEDAGYRVRLPDRQLCCGRPLYDYGFLDRAQRYLDRLVGALSGPVADGAKVVGMEPSCVAVFRDELLNLRPHDEDARRLADATMTLGEFLTGEADYDFPRLSRRAVVHGHCHHKGSLGLSGMTRALDALGLDWHELDAGCCGLAGSFGFEAGEKYDVSVRAGERKLLPAVRDTAPATLLVADGFSCRTQVTQLQELNGTGGGPRRRPLHLAQVIRMARATGPQGPDGPGPVEDAWMDGTTDDWSWRDTAAVGAVGAGLAASLWRAYSRD